MNTITMRIVLLLLFVSHWSAHAQSEKLDQNVSKKPSAQEKTAQKKDEYRHTVHHKIATMPLEIARAQEACSRKMQEIQQQQINTGKLEKAEEAEQRKQTMEDQQELIRLKKQEEALRKEYEKAQRQEARIEYEREREEQREMQKRVQREEAERRAEQIATQKLKSKTFNAKVSVRDRSRQMMHARSFPKSRIESEMVIAQMTMNKEKHATRERTRLRMQALPKPMTTRRTVTAKLAPREKINMEECRTTETRQCRMREQEQITWTEAPREENKMIVQNCTTELSVKEKSQPACDALKPSTQKNMNTQSMECRAQVSASPKTKPGASVVVKKATMNQKMVRANPIKSAKKSKS